MVSIKPLAVDVSEANAIVLVGNVGTMVSRLAAAEDVSTGTLVVVPSSMGPVDAIVVGISKAVEVAASMGNVAAGEVSPRIAPVEADATVVTASGTDAADVVTSAKTVVALIAASIVVKLPNSSRTVVNGASVTSERLACRL